MARGVSERYTKKETLQKIVAELFLDNNAGDLVIDEESETEIVVYNTETEKEYTIRGSNLSADFDKNKLTGKVESITETDFDEEDRSFDFGAANHSAPGFTFTFPSPTKLKDLNDAADSIKGKVTEKKAKAMDSVIQPEDSPFPNYDYTGSDETDVARGYDTGDDAFVLGGSKDTVFMTKGNDSVDGGSQRDTLDASLMKGPVDINLKAGAAVANNGKSVTTLTSVENAVGSKRDDKLRGDSEDNNLNGGNGDDTMEGGKGEDTLVGGKGDDNLTGGKKGGGGDGETDVFEFKFGAKNGTDKITDYEEGVDVIKISGAKKKDINVKQQGDDTIITYDDGKIRLEDVLLDKSEIIFDFS